jgi:hypothetical protein
MDNDDILDVLGSNEKAFDSKTATKTETETKGEYVKDEFDYWNDVNVEPVKVKTADFNSTGKSFTMCVFNQREELSEEVENKLFKIAEHLVGKGYLFRHTGDHKDKLQTRILEIDGVVTQSYLPWKKFNLLIERPKLFKPKGPAFGIAVNSHKGYAKLSPAVRFILARNVHAILGPKVDDPVTLVLAYSKDGAEAMKRDMDFKLTGDVAFYLKVCEDSSIPIFNTKNEDVTKRLSEFLKTKD